MPARNRSCGQCRGGKSSSDLICRRCAHFLPGRRTSCRGGAHFCRGGAHFLPRVVHARHAAPGSAPKANSRQRRPRGGSHARCHCRPLAATAAAPHSGGTPRAGESASPVARNSKAGKAELARIAASANAPPKSTPNRPSSEATIELQKTGMGLSPRAPRLHAPEKSRLDLGRFSRTRNRIGPDHAVQCDSREARAIIDRSRRKACSSSSDWSRPQSCVRPRWISRTNW
jgi:hypothetical protein